MIIPGAAGEYGVTMGHSPIVAEMKPGVLQVLHGDVSYIEYSVYWAFCIVGSWCWCVVPSSREAMSHGETGGNKRNSFLYPKRCVTLMAHMDVFVCRLVRGPVRSSVFVYAGKGAGAVFRVSRVRSDTRHFRNRRNCHRGREGG